MSVVAAANQPSNTGVANSSGIITQALRDLGINPVAQGVSDINLTTVSVDQIGADALRINGVNPIAVTDQPVIADTIAASEIASRALREVGINPVSTHDQPTASDTVTIAEIAARALRATGYNLIAQSVMTQVPTFTTTAGTIAGNALIELGVNQGGNATPTSTVFSVSDVGSKALILLNIVASDETPSSTDLAYAVAWATAFQDEMVASGYASWGPNAIPDYVMNLYAIAVAAQIAPGFEKEADKEGFAGAVAAIKNFAMTASAAQAYAIVHLTQINQMLIGKNLSNWLQSAIPDPVAEYYTTLLVQEMATSFGKQFDPAAYNGAIAGIKRYALSGTQGQALAASLATSIHDKLAGLGYTSWLSTAIPGYVAQAYVDMTVRDLVFDIVDPTRLNTLTARAQEAEAQMRVFALSGAYGQTLALNLTTSAHDTLAQLGLVTWQVSAVPGYAAEAYVSLVARDLAFDLKQPELMTAFEAKAQEARAQIKVMALSGTYGQALAKAEVLRVQEQLNAENLVAWPWLAIPAAVSPYYTQMVAVQLAAQLGHEQNWKVWEQAKDQIRTVVLSGDYAIAIAQQEFDNIQASLVSAGIVSWDEMSIPMGVADSYSMLLALNIAPIFGKPSDGKGVAAAFEQVRKVSMLMGSQALAEQVLRGLHSEWRMREMIRWEIFDIPREAEEAYVEATAFRLGPQFPEMAPGFDPNAEMRAELMLYRAASLPSDGRTVEVSYF